MPDLYKKIAFSILLACFMIGALYFASFLPSADWLGIYDATARHALAGNSPYDRLYPGCVHCVFVNPPWTLLILLPFTLLPPNLSRGLIFMVSLVCIIYFGWRMRARPISMAAMILSPTIIGSLLAGNLDALILLGMFLPPAWGLLLLMIKPQIGLGVAIFYAIVFLRERKWGDLARALLPVMLAYLISAWLYPDWLKIILYMPVNPWNRSIFPYGIPLALALLGLAFWRKNVFLALAASPFLSTYLTYYSYGTLQFGLLDSEVEKVVPRDVLQVILAILFWAVMLYFRL
jgi:hypothetical protein